MFDPLSSEDMAQKIWAVWNDDRRLAELRALGTEQVKKFNWKKLQGKQWGFMKKSPQDNRIDYWSSHDKQLW